MKKQIVALLMCTCAIFSAERTSQASPGEAISVDSLHKMVKVLEAALKAKEQLNTQDTLRIELIEKDSSSTDFFSIEWADDTTEEKKPRREQQERSNTSYKRGPELLYRSKNTSYSQSRGKRKPIFGLGYKFSLMQTLDDNYPCFQWSLDFLLKEKHDLQLYFAMSEGGHDSYGRYDPYLNTYIYEDSWNDYYEWRFSYLRLIGKGVKKIGLGGEAGAGVGSGTDNTVATFGPKVSFQLRWNRFVFAIEDGIHVVPNFDHKVGARVSFMLF